MRLRQMALSSGGAPDVSARQRANAVQTNDGYEIVPLTNAESSDNLNNKIALITPILLAVLIVEGGVLFALMKQADADREAARTVAQEQRDQADADRREQERARTEPVRVPLATIKHSCNATNGEATCYVTNFDGPPIVACMQGLLVQKEAAGVRLYSMPMCSGPVRPNETRAISAPWDGGRAGDMCKSAAGYLDFDKCMFTVIDYENKSQ